MAGQTKISWHLRCLPALTALALIAFTTLVFNDLPALALQGFTTRAHASWKLKHHADSWAYLQAVWCLYLIAMHFLTWVYNARLTYSLIRTTSKIKRAAEDEARTERLPPLGAINHMIMLPAYKEDIDTLQETLDVFASHDQAKSDYHFYLAMEEKDPNAESVAKEMVERYALKFASIQYTIHPTNIPGEAPGKSSNISWCARQIMEQYHDHPSKSNFILTVMDADTHLQSSYFAQITRMHLDALAAPLVTTVNKYESYDANSTIYCPTIVFDRNAHVVPGFVRMADLMWTLATMSGLFPGSAIGTPTSVYSVPLQLASRVGGWDTNSTAIGEDLHMMCKCFFTTKGSLRVRTVYSPASQCNVCSDLHGVRGYIDSLQARWKQAIRHMWGSLDTGYSYSRGYDILCEIRAQSKQAKQPSALPSYGEKRLSEDGYPPISLWYFICRFLPLYHRLFEAHMLPMQLMTALLSCVLYTALVPPAVTPWMLQATFDITGYMRGVGWIMMACNFLIYERYHSLAVTLREKALKRAGLSQGATFSKRQGLQYWLDYAFFPVGGIVFGSIPAIVSQICHFWTEDLVYHVSAKPKRVMLENGKIVDVVPTAFGDKVVSVVSEKEIVV